MSLYSARVSALRKTLLSKKEKSDILNSLSLQKQKVCEIASADHAKALLNLEMDSKVVEVLKILVEKFSFKGMGFLEDLVSRGLQTIFVDDVYKFDIEIEDRGANKTLEFWVVGNDGVRVSLSDCGGGIQAVVSFIFQVYFIIQLNLPKVLFLDEAFARLSLSYSEGLMSFMKALRDELGFDVLWITHSDHHKAGEVDRTYTMNKGELKCV